MPFFCTKYRNPRFFPMYQTSRSYQSTKPKNFPNDDDEEEEEEEERDESKKKKNRKKKKKNKKKKKK